VRYHTGCGIVWDSDPADEYAESLLKTAVLSHATEPFELIETMRAEPGRGILNSEGHLNRLRTSAEELGFELDEREVQASMENIVHRIDTPSKARLLLNANGTFTLTCDPLPTPAETMTFRIDPGRTPAEHPELRHKTTRRDVYRQARERCPDSDETLMINKRGELMEFTIGNVVVEIDGTAYTPPVSAGLLRGTARESDLKNGTLTERVLTPEDLKRAEGIYLLNAVRGWVEMIHIP